MNTSFWDGFLSGIRFAVPYSISFLLGAALYGALYTHPYDECSSQHTTPEDISECVWIIQNN